jgi:hypothetical protein
MAATGLLFLQGLLQVKHRAWFTPPGDYFFAATFAASPL